MDNPYHADSRSARMKLAYSFDFIYCANIGITNPS